VIDKQLLQRTIMVHYRPAFLSTVARKNSCLCFKQTNTLTIATKFAINVTMLLRESVTYLTHSLRRKQYPSFSVQY